MDFKINVIGVGIMGKNVCRALVRNPLVRLTAAANLSSENLEAAKAEFKLERTYRDYREMIGAEKPDAVFVATPDWAHYHPVMTCLDAGIHVHVEKPLTTREAEAATTTAHRARYRCECVTG